MGLFLHSWFRLRVGVSPISLVVVTAADRAAATCQRWVPTNYRKGAGEGFQRAIAKPFGRLRRGEIPRPQTRPHAAMVAAALSAAVTSTTLQRTAPTSQAEPSKKKAPRQTPAALREGARGRGFSQRSRLPRIPRTFPIPRSGLSPRISQFKQSLREGARGRGLLYREAPSLAKPS